MNLPNGIMSPGSVYEHGLRADISVKRPCAAIKGASATGIDGASMMLMALVLVCSLQVTPDLADCSRANAVNVIRVPEEFGSPTTCLMHGQAYLADTSIGRDLDETQRVKVVCTRTVSQAEAARVR